MNRRQKLIAGIVLGLLLVLVVVLYTVNRRAAFLRTKPAWLDPGQPPEGVAAEWGTLAPAQSWAANRCGPINACCTGRTAGRRVRRTYPESLAASDDSFIRASFDLTAEC